MINPNSIKRMMELGFKQAQGTILVYRHFGTTNQSVRELIGLKNHRKNNPKQIIFQFLVDPEIARNDVLQQKVSKDQWQVTDTSETIAGDVVLTYDVEVEKLNSPAKPQPGNNVVVQGSVYGGLQIASPHAIQQNLVQGGVGNCKAEQLVANEGKQSITDAFLVELEQIQTLLESQQEWFSRLRNDLGINAYSRICHIPLATEI